MDRSVSMTALCSAIWRCMVIQTYLCAQTAEPEFPLLDAVDGVAADAVDKCASKGWLSGRGSEQRLRSQQKANLILQSFPMRRLAAWLSLAKSGLDEAVF
jgi:hypothetical protein